MVAARAVIIMFYYFLVHTCNNNFLLCCRAVGSQVVMDPYQICKKTRRLRGKMVEICQNANLLNQISKGVSLGEEECSYQFRYRRWNCTSARKSMRKVLLRG